MGIWNAIVTFLRELAQAMLYDPHATAPEELAMNKTASTTPFITAQNGPQATMHTDMAPVPQKPVYDWSTPAAARHSARVIMDEEGITYDRIPVRGTTYTAKDVLCACIMQESRFYNYLPSGQPVKNHNRDAAGNITSTDWGIVQINDTPGWHIGPGLEFASVQDVLDHPDHAVRYMVRMYKAGLLKRWSSYSSGAFKTWLV